MLAAVGIAAMAGYAAALKLMASSGGVLG